MKKTILFIIQLAVIIVVSMFLIKNQLPVVIEFADYKLTTNSSFVFLFLFIFMGLFSIVYKILEGICYAPKNIKRKIDYNKQIKGLGAVIDGLFFLSIGQNKQALKAAKTAAKKLPKHIMTQFLSAKSYLADGNFEKAKREYGKIIRDEKYRSLGFNGLIEIAIIQNREEEIYNLSKQAYLLDSKNGFALLNLIDCQIEDNEMEKAKENIKKAGRLKAVSKDEAKLRLAEIAYVDCIKAIEAGDLKQAMKEISTYYELDVDYLDTYVDLLIKNDQARKAKNIVKKEWKKNPYYQIASMWIRLGPSGILKKVNHAKELLKDWPSSHIAFELVAKACVDAEIWGEAKDYLTKAIETEEKVSHYLLMAKVEKHGFKNHEQHDFWIRKAEKEVM